MSQVMPQISFGFDILITCLLAATIYFAIKLTRHLDSFRSNRADMENLIRELSTQITRAQEGISVLDDLSANRGDELRRIITKGQDLSDELQLMTESGNSLAQRLEIMAVRNREIVDEMDSKALSFVYPGGKNTSPTPPLTATKPARYEETLSKADKAEKTAESPFFIRDPDYDAEDDKIFNDDGFSSQAERDLADALKRRKPTGK
jgi:hypothetical protein